MKKKYTKKQIQEAIAYWKKQIKLGNYKKLNENINYEWCEYDDLDNELIERNSCRTYFNFREPYNTYGGGIIAASSKESLAELINKVLNDISNEEYIIYMAGPLVTSTDNSNKRYSDPVFKNYIRPSDDLSLGLKIANAVLSGKYVTFLRKAYDPAVKDENRYEEDIMVFEPCDEIEEVQDYWFEV